MLSFDKVTCLYFLIKFVLSQRLSNRLRGSDNLLFSEFINISVLFYNFIEFIMFHIFLVMSSAQYKKYI